MKRHRLRLGKNSAAEPQGPQCPHAAGRPFETIIKTTKKPKTKPKTERTSPLEPSPPQKLKVKQKPVDFWGVGWCFARGRGLGGGGVGCVSWPRRPVAGGKRKILAAEAGAVAPRSRTPPRRGRGTRGGGMRAGSIPVPWAAAGMQPAAWRGPRESAILHVGCLKWWLPPFFLPLSATVSARMHPRGGEGEGPRPPAREGAGEREPRWN